MLTSKQTQLQILTAVVKLFLKRPDKAQGLVQKVLQAATAENDNPDIRDRAYVYWRLLSNTSDPNAAKNVVLSEKPPIVTTIQSLPPTLLDQLLNELSTLASVYHKPPEQFIGQGRFGADAVMRAAIEYVFSLTFWLSLANLAIGNNSRTPARTLWQQQPLPLPSVVRLPPRHRTMSRTCWISTSMAPHRLLHRKSPRPACPVWKVLLARLCASSRLPSVHLRQATTSTTCWAYLAAVAILHPPRTPALAAPTAVRAWT